MIYVNFTPFKFFYSSYAENKFPPIIQICQLQALIISFPKLAMTMSFTRGGVPFCLLILISQKLLMPEGKLRDEKGAAVISIL